MPVNRRILTAAIAAMLAIGVGVPAFVAPPIAAEAATRKDVEEQQKKNASKRAKIQAELDETNEELASVYLKLSDSQDKLKVAKIELKVAEADYVKAKREADELQQRLGAAEGERKKVEDEIAANEQAIKEAEDTLAEMAREAATDGPIAASSLGLLLNSASVEDLISNYEAADVAATTQQDALFQLEQQRGTMANQRARLRAIEVKIADLKEKADAKLAEAEEAKERAAKKRAEIEKLVSDQKKLAADLKKAREKFMAEKKKLDADKRKLDAQLAEIARKEAAAFKRGAKVRVTGGALGWPVDNAVISSPFGYRWHPVVGAYMLHSGTDFAAGCGTPIRAAASGQVLWASWMGTYGQQVALSHGIMGGVPTQTTYSHQSKMAVHAGQVVQRGQIIGYVGTTGRSTGCHLHYEVHKNGAAVNPMQYY